MAHADEPDGARYRRSRRRLLIAGNLVGWGLIPAAWLIGVWWLGTKLDHLSKPYLSALLFLLLLTGMPSTMYAFARQVFKAEARLAARAGVESSFRLRPPRSRRRKREVVEPPPRPPLSRGRRAASLLLSVAMFATTLALWGGVPVGWIWIASQLSSSTQPAVWPYLLVITGIVVSAFVGARFLASLARLHAAVIGEQGRRAGPPPWRRSFRDSPPMGAGASGLDRVMVVSVVLAVLVFAVWFFFFADPKSGILPPEFQ